MSRKSLATLFWLAAACGTSGEFSPIEPPTSSPPSDPTPRIEVFGDDQVGILGFSLADSLGVRFLDSAGSPVEGAEIIWMVPERAGHLSETTTHTDFAGRSQVQWTLPAHSEAGVSQYGVRASIGDSTIFFSATALGEPDPELEPTGPLSEGPTDYSLFFPATGPVHGVVIFGSYRDLPWAEDPASLYERIFPEMITWFKEASYGRLDLVLDPLPQWLELPRLYADYQSQGFLLQLWVEDILAMADPEIDFTDYDAVFFVSSGYRPSGGPALVGAGAGFIHDGVEVRGILGFSPRGFIEEIWWQIVVHETGHYFGLPDLYGGGSVFGYAGSWDVMSHLEDGAHFFGWHKRKLGWLYPDEVLTLEYGGVEVVIQPLEVLGGLKLVVVKTSPWTAYLIEVRQPIGYDSFLCDSGVLVYHADSRIGTGQGPIRVSRFSGTGGRCGPLTHAPLDVGPGEVARFEDPITGFSAEVVAHELDGAYRVRIKRDPPPE